MVAAFASRAEGSLCGGGEVFEDDALTSFSGTAGFCVEVTGSLPGKFALFGRQAGIAHQVGKGTEDASTARGVACRLRQGSSG